MQKVISFITFFIILAIGYYWLFVDQDRVDKMSYLTESDHEIVGNVNTVQELERRLELRYIGHGKHLQQIQDEFKAHYIQYQTKMDSLDLVLEEIKFIIEQLEDRLVKKIDRNKDDIENLTDSFDSFKRKSNRTVREIQLDISTLKDDINVINERIDEFHKKKK